jgi:hypothetical protein
MYRKNILALLVVALLGAGTAFAGKTVGEITYVSGDVSIARRGAVLSGVNVIIGDPVEDYDLIRTGPKGTIDLVLRTPQKQQIRLKVQANTSFSIETSRLGAGKERTSLQMMSGTLSCKVDKLAGNDLQVKTKGAAMGVKGTEFTVTTSPADDVLITCDEGAVSCVDADSGVQAVAEQGQAVERAADAALAAIKVTDDLELFRQKWLQNRLSAFQRVAARHIQGMGRLFTPAYTKMKANFSQLKQKMPILQKWIDQDKQGLKSINPVNPAEARKENFQVLPALLKVKIYLTVFEPLYFRLVDLQYYYSQGYGSDDPAVKKYFAEFDGQKKDVEEMLVFIRYCIRLYADRNDGYFPLDDFADGFGK